MSHLHCSYAYIAWLISLIFHSVKCYTDLQHGD